MEREDQIKPQKIKQLKDQVVKVVKLEFDEYENKDCQDQRYGCKCVNYEKCCGCLLQ